VAIVCLVAFFIAGLVAAQWKSLGGKQETILLNSFSVHLPDGDSLSYENRALERRTLGPADTEKILIWHRKDGQSQTYSISSIGAGYGEIEFRMRPDGKAVWLIDWADKKVAAALDLSTTRFTTDGCVMYWGFGGCSDSESPGKPKWATLDGGKSLGRKRF